MPHSFPPHFLVHNASIWWCLFFTHFVSHRHGLIFFLRWKTQTRLSLFSHSVSIDPMYIYTRCLFFFFCYTNTSSGEGHKERPSQAPKTGSHSDLWACEPNISVSQNFTISDTSGRPPFHLHLLVWCLLSRPPITLPTFYPQKSHFYASLPPCVWELLSWELVDQVQPLYV